MIITTIDYGSEAFLQLLGALKQIIGSKQSLFLFRGNEDSETVEYTLSSDWLIDYDRYMYKRSAETIHATSIELKFRVAVKKEKEFTEQIKALLR